MNNIFVLSLGDWSGDGHGRHEDMRIKSNYSVEEVREMYFNAVEKSGVNFCEEFCAEYEECTIPENKAQMLPFSIENYSELYKESYYMDTDSLTKLFLDWIKYYNPEFEYEIIPPEPMLHFYGFDEKHRYIPSLGYGLFMN